MMGKRYSCSILIALPVLFFIVASCGSETGSSTLPVPQATTKATIPSSTLPPSPPSPKQYDVPPTMTIDSGKSYTATLNMEKGGEVVIELFSREAPGTVNNFVFLAQDGYYDGVTFHRVIEGFMAQSGDPTGTGSGGPGYTVKDEFSPLRRHDGPGILSMANTGRVIMPPAWCATNATS